MAKPTLDSQVKEAWTLNDLRKLRFQQLGTVDPNMERMNYG